MYNFSDELSRRILKYLRQTYPLVYVLYVFEALKKLIHNIKLRLYSPKQGEVWCVHRVVPQRSNYKSNCELEITPDYLEQQIKIYKKKGYRFVPIDSIVSGVSSILKRKRVNISFDDGFRDVYDYAFPILKREQIPFTLFLTTGMPENTTHLWWLQLEQLVYDNKQFENALKEIYDRGENMSEYFCKKYKVSPDYSLTKRVSLSWEQVREMVDSGLCSIGSHSISHPALTRIPKERIREELSLSRRQIIEHLGVEPIYFSYPHSMTNMEVQNLVREAGYTYAFMGYGGAVRKGDNLYHINRQYIIQP